MHIRIMDVRYYAVYMTLVLTLLYSSVSYAADIPAPAEPRAGQPAIIEPAPVKPVKTDSAAAPAPPAAPQPPKPATIAPQAQPVAPAPVKPLVPPPVSPVQPQKPTVTPPNAQKPQATPAPQPVQPVPNASAAGSSFFFDDADVFEVIQTVFGEVLRVNYIIDPAVKGRVNFRTTTPIPREKILPVIEIILRLNGIAVVEESSLYRIIPIGNISKEPAPIRFGNRPDSVELKGISLMQLVPLTYITSTEMAAILTPMLTQGGAIHDISKRNVLIIADTDANVKRLLQVIATFDIDSRNSTNQPRIYVYPVQNSKAKGVSDILHHVLLGGAAPSSASTAAGVKTSTGSAGTTPAQPAPGPVAPRVTGTGGTGESLVAPNTKIVADETNNMLVIFATPGDYSTILSAIKQIDTIPRQVMIEAIVASVALTDNLTFGLKWNARVNANIDNIKPLSTTPQTLLGNLGFQNISGVDTGSFGYTITDKSGGVRAAIEALSTDNKAKILSAPQLLVADNKEAKIQVGSQIPLATSTTSTPIATTSTTVTNTTTSTIQYKDVGTILTVKPQINDSGLVSIELTQEVSDYILKSVLGTTQYIITKKEVKSNLVVQDGQTIIIGGLVSEKIDYDRSSIPFLGKIPLLGYLFGSTTDNKERQELLILLTPRVVRNPADAQKMTSEYSDRFKNVEKEINIKDFKKSSADTGKLAPKPSDPQPAKK